MNINKRCGVATVGIIIVVAVAASFLGYFYRTQTAWVESPPYQRATAEPTRTIVVVYSRTGNTFGAAKEAARFFNADLLQIKAPQYARTIEGQMLASKHADEEVTTTPIEHDPVTLSDYDLIVLCSPTWWFRPAPPLWSFVENHDFGGKRVFLMMTGNSRLKAELIDKFDALVEKNNGKFLDTLFIQRGRIYWQKTPNEVNEEVRQALESRNSIWPVKPRNEQ